MTQPVPDVDELDVRRVVHRDFPANDQPEAVAALDRYAPDKPTHHRARVQLAALKLASSSLDSLLGYIRTANLDFRDVIAPAGYPAYLRTPNAYRLTSEQKQDLYDNDREQYQRWLNRP